MTRTLSIRLVPEAAQAELVFRYDEEIVAVIRALRQRRWHRSRLWTVARSEIDGLCRELEGRDVRVTVQGAAMGSTANGAIGGGSGGQADAALSVE